MNVSPSPAVGTAPMDELDKALGICLQGPPALHALEKMRRQAALWQVALPPVAPRVSVSP